MMVAAAWAGTLLQTCAATDLHCYRSKNHATRTEISLRYFSVFPCLAVRAIELAEGELRSKIEKMGGHPFKSWLLSLSKFQTLGRRLRQSPLQDGFAAPWRPAYHTTNQIPDYIFLFFSVTC